MIFVGIDVHKEKCVAFFLDTQTGRTWVVEFFSTKASIEAFAHAYLQKDMVVGLEATCNSWFVAMLLRKYVEKVIMVAPQGNKDGIKRDSKDAQRIAISLAQGTYKGCWIPTLPIYILRHIEGYWVNLGKEINRLKNRLQATLMANGIRLSHRTPFSKEGREELEKKLKDLPHFISWELSSILRRLNTAKREKQELESILAEIAKQEPQVHLLVTIPGISFVSALFILAELGDIRRFESPKQTVRYGGLCPNMYQSGGKCYYGGITKRGRKLLRWILTQSANNAIRVENRISKFYYRLRDRGKHHNVAVVACARKMVEIIWYMLRSREVYRDFVGRLYEKKEKLMEKKTRNVPTISLTQLIAQLTDFLNREEADIPIANVEAGKEVVKTY